MNEYVYESEKVENLTLEVVLDDDPCNPREDTLLGHLCLDHGRYDLPWESPIRQKNPIYYARSNSTWDGTFEYIPMDCESWDDVEIALAQAVKQAGDEIVVFLPVYMLDHSGVALRVSDPLRDFGNLDPFRHYYMGWDSGKVGYIYATRKEILGWYGETRLSPTLRRKVDEDLRAEVKAYSAYLNGSMYICRIKDEDDEILDSCGSFLEVKDALEWGKEEAHHYFKEEING